MVSPFQLQLDLLDCTQLHSEEDIAAGLEFAQTQGVLVGTGPRTRTTSPQPVTDVRAYLPSVRLELEAKQRAQAGRRVGPTTVLERWGFSFVHREMPEINALGTVMHYGLDLWSFSILVDSW